MAVYYLRYIYALSAGVLGAIGGIFGKIASNN